MAGGWLRRVVGLAMVVTMAPAARGQVELTALERDVVETGDAAALAATLGRVERGLEEQAWGEDVLVGLFVGCRPNPAAWRLAVIVTEATGELEGARASVGRLLEYVDWYEGADWAQRFEATGLYERLQELEAWGEYLECVRAYYAGRLAVVAEVRGGEAEQEVVAQVRAARERLGQWTSRGDKAGERAQLWRARLGRVLVELGAGEAAVAADQMQGRLWPLESLRRQAAEAKGLTELGMVEREVAGQAEAGVETAVFRSGLLQRMRAGALGRRVEEQEVYLGELGWVEPLRGVDGETGRRLVGERLMAAFAGLKEEEREAANERFLREADWWVLWALGEQVLRAEGEAALVLEQAVEKAREAGVVEGGLLYEAGLANYRTYRAGRDAGYGVRAVEHWCALARRGANAEEVRRGLELGAAAAVGLWSERPGEYGALAEEVLGLLVKREGAEEYWYWYGRVLAGQGRYGEAREWLVKSQGVDEGRACEARYWAAWCRVRELEAGEATAGAWEEVLGEVRGVGACDAVERKSVTGLAAAALGRLGRTEEAVRLLGEQWQEGEELCEAAMGMLAAELAAVEGMYARGEGAELAERLRRGAELAGKVYEWCGEDGAAVRTWAQWQSLAAVAVGEVTDDIEEVLAELGEQRWVVRCRARLAWAAGEYERSRRLWQEVREGLEPEGSAAERAWYWESRYWGLRCLAAEGRQAEARHAAGVLRRTEDWQASEWAGRIAALGE